MPVLTPAALAHLEMLLRQTKAPKEVSMRIEQATAGSPVKVTMGQPDAGDKQFRYHGRTVLVLDRETADRLRDKTLDVEPTEEGPRFVLK